MGFRPVLFMWPYQYPWVSFREGETDHQVSSRPHPCGGGGHAGSTRPSGGLLATEAYTAHQATGFPPQGGGDASFTSLHLGFDLKKRRQVLKRP